MAPQSNRPINSFDELAVRLAEKTDSLAGKLEDTRDETARRFDEQRRGFEVEIGYLKHELSRMAKQIEQMESKADRTQWYVITTVIGMLISIALRFVKLG